MSKLFCRLFYYQLIGWCGFVATFSLLLNIFVDWGWILGWITIVSTTIFFYTTTIEAEFVECEQASFITIPAGLIMIFSGFYPMNAIVLVLGAFALAYALIEMYPQKFPHFAKLLKVEPRRAVYMENREKRLEKIRQEVAAYKQQQQQQLSPEA
jgi:hypothetical protein